MPSCSLAEKGKLTAKNRDGILHWIRAASRGRQDLPGRRRTREEGAAAELRHDVRGASRQRGGDVNFLIRGEVEKKGPVMKPGFVQVLMNAADAEQHWTGPSRRSSRMPPRVALANWLTDTEQGAGNLLARVIVNRLWQHHMGRGIVATPNDFGAQGEPPTHPELLDYLARELIKNGWKLKPIHKLIMTSAVYMQAERGQSRPT